MSLNVVLLGYGVLCASGQEHPKRLRDKIEFNRDIRPIVSKCLACHGHDPKQIQAGLNLDNFAGATALLPSGDHAIVPGHSEQSILLERINAKDASIMPPPESNKFLSAEEKQLLAQWIEEGAVYKPHWAFVAPVRPPLPVVKLKTWPKNAIDTFILAELEKHGLHPSPQADKPTLLRRVTLDLTGLPPTPKELDAFLADKSPNAYEKVVDRLLTSPRFGERMAMDWMDDARYADSNGYQADWERYQWRWRDWVIDAFNQNKPFDQFTIEQLAGDLLPNATLEQKIATGFNRNHRINTEGGVIAEEWRVENVIDRVETTSQVWLGLTAGCARCHDHKYDPISQRDFYSLFAYFNNVPESGTGVEAPVNHPPVLKAPTPAQIQELNALKTRLATLDGKIAQAVLAHTNQAQGWKLAASQPPASLSNGLAVRYAFTETTKTLAGTAPPPKIVGKLAFDTGRSTGAVATDAKNFLDLGDVGDFDAAKPYSYSVWINPKNGSGSPVARMDQAHNYRGWDVMLIDGRPATHLISDWPTNALKVISRTVVPNNEWSHIAVTYDGSSKIEGLKIYVNGKLTETDAEVKTLTGPTHANVSARIGRRTEDSSFTGKVDDLSIYSRTLEPAEVAALASVHPAKGLLAIPIDKRTKGQRQEIARLWLMEHSEPFKQLDAEQRSVTKAHAKLDSSIPTVMVMEEMPKQRDAFVLIRGQYDKHGDKVAAALPKVFPPLPKGAPNNRLGLAKWIVDPANPLTARVAVNRFWERFFGTGIVATGEDFGTRAEFPSHPELLDWLATEFVRTGWNIKATLKEIVMSATYRQNSTVTEQLLAADPENRLLARGPRFRLPAEVIRDQAMFVGGLLVEKLGGPSVRPYQPEGIWDETNVYGNLRNYKHDTGPNLYRRSLYTIWKRTAAPPEMTLFDVPGRETCRVRRARTDTPLQALVLMNDVTYVEAARALAQRAIEQAGATPDKRIDFMYRSVLSRAPSAAELQILEGGLAKRLQHFRADIKSANEFVYHGDLPQDPKLSVAEVAAYMVTASTILNLDEAITKE